MRWPSCAVVHACLAAAAELSPASYRWLDRSQCSVGSADRRRRRLLLPGGGRAVVAFGASPRQALAVATQCLHQLRPEQSQPGRDDDRPARTVSCFATIAISEIYGLQRADIAAGMTGRDLLELRLKRGVLDARRRGIRRSRATPGRSGHANCPTGGRSSSRSSRCRMAARSQPMRIAPSSASCRATRLDQAVPGIGARQRAGLRRREEHRGRPLHLRQSCVRAILRGFPAITSSASAPTRSSRPASAASIEATDRAALRFAGRTVSQRIRGRARLAEAHARLHPRRRAQRARTSRNS